MDNKLQYGFRMVHIDNVPYVREVGFVRPDSSSASDRYVSIGDPSIISKRKDVIRDGFKLDEYIPFYFGPRSPMLYVIQHGYQGVKRVSPQDIVYCVIRLEDIINDHINCVFTDGHALDAFTRYLPGSSLAQIDQYVKWEDVYAQYWNSEDDYDLKRRKEAELLIKGSLSPQYIKGFVVYNEYAKHKLINDGIEEGQIAVRSNYYF